MVWNRTLLASYLALVVLSSISTSGAFSGSFEMSDLCVDSPFQKDAMSTTNSTISFTFFDENTPQLQPTSCFVTWVVGIPPPIEPAPGTCLSKSVHVSFPSGSYKGVANLYIQITHTYEDDGIGQAPYNILTLIGGVQLTYGVYGGTPNYQCDMDTARCQSLRNTVIIGNVTEAVA